MPPAGWPGADGPATGACGAVAPPTTGADPATDADAVTGVDPVDGGEMGAGGVAEGRAGSYGFGAVHEPPGDPERNGRVRTVRSRRSAATKA
ncbi:hypothetical protein ACFQX7_35010 [Luedemannella flava]